jgi:hypothetical protein
MHRTGVCRPMQQGRLRHSRAAAAVVDAAQAGQQTVSVCEYLLSFQLKADRQPQQAVAALEALWALQFMLPGCLCAFGGLVLQESAFMHGTGAQCAGASGCAKHSARSTPALCACVE